MASKGLETQATVTIASGAALSEAFRFVGRLAMLIMPAAWTAADIGYYVCDTVDGTFVPAYDDAGTLIATSVDASQGVVVPADMAPAKYVKLWSNTAGVDTNQGADREIVVLMKE